MKIERHIIGSCCGGTSIIFKIDQPISKKLLESLVGLGYKETEQYTKAGILYAINVDFIITGPFGSNKLQVKCKKKDCDKKLNDLENLFLSMG